MNWIKSPLNYIGNKYRIIGQLYPLFPKKIPCMIDLFCGGCDVSINTRAEHTIANDINIHVIDIFNEFKKLGCEKTLSEIDSIIARWNLSKDNEEGYIRFRDHYNRTRRPLDLYVLMCHSFNYQFRFNAAHEFNNPFGRSRSSFNAVMRRNLELVFPDLDRISFESSDFTNFDYDRINKGDFVYADPPYLLTCGSYNDGKRGFRGWTEYDDVKLYEILDMLHERGVKFALSNVIHHKGKIHSILKDWAKENDYEINFIKFDYNNCNYQARNNQNITNEVLVTNYSKPARSLSLLNI